MTIDILRLVTALLINYLVGCFAEPAAA